MACPAPEVLSSVVDGTIPRDARAAVEAHVDECDDCRRTMALLARARVAERPPPRSPALADTEVDTDPAPSPPSRVLEPGTRVARYVIRDVIGKGGMGVVYAADDPELNREVAIKLLRHDFARQHPDATRRIVREARAMAKIAHPNVVAIHDVGSVDDQVFIAMERVRGTSLRKWIDGQRSVAAIVDAFAAAGRGLVAAHDAGIVHRDFKPDNVLVGDDGRVRVTDFGLALDEAGERLSSPELAASGTLPIAGTPAYMAPEQHAGGNVDPRSDQFSFCVALYEAIYRKRPFGGSTRSEVAAAVATGTIEPPPPGARVPRSLRDILVRGLATVPGDRFATMDELLHALGRDRGRRPRRVALGAAVLLLAVLVALGADWIARGRAYAITKTSFGAARAQLARLLELRTESFRTQADLVKNVRVFQQVVDNRDDAEFGLGTPEHDRDKLAALHAALQSADWVGFVGASADLAIADYKGRLLYAGADRAAWGADATASDQIAAIYRAGGKVALGVVRGDDADVVRSGILGRGRAGLFVLFGRATVIDGQPRALYVQLVEGAKLLDEVRLGEHTQLALVAHGAVVGGVPAEVVARSGGAGIADVDHDGATWLVQRYPLDSPDASAPIAEIVVARETDVGVGALFPHARATLGGAAALLFAIVIAGFAIARRRDLTRPVLRVAPAT